VEPRTEALPALGPEDVRVRAVASALSHGTEMLVYRGQVPAELPLDLPTLRGSFAFPIKYGYASVGRVVEAGSRVESLHPGDLVFTLHPHQDEYVVPATMPVPLPPALPAELGVFLANVETAVNILLDAAPRLGERVLIFGQGVVGLLVTQLLRRAGVGLVVAVDVLPERRRLALELGAHVALAPDEDVPATVRRLTDGIGVDLAIEVSGNGAALDRAIESVCFQGTVVVCSWYGTKPVKVVLGGRFHRDRLRLVSSQVGHIDPALQPRWSHARRLALARDLLGELQLAPLITHRIPFHQAAEAYALVDEHPEQVVQVILTYEEGSNDV
jgi:2-desacetyl-2-hydroxyethyl bacteriochlorophyllide A dehydrogenase